jgi:hypothetical protein
VLPLALRLVLLPVFPRPLPEVHDEFSYLLLADTFAHGRLANPSPALPEFFETFHVLVRPVYASMYAVGQGAVLAAGRLLFGHPWWGVVLSVGLMCGAVCWLLQAFVGRRWALFGGLSFSLLFGVEHAFMNSYWGGALPAAAGAALAGATARLVLSRGAPRHPVGLGLLVGASAGTLLNTRPWEGFWAALPAAVLLAVWLVRSPWGTLRGRLLRVALPALAPLALAAAFLLVYNTRVTGDPFQTPYLLSLRTHYVAPLFVWEKERPAPAYNHEVMRRFYVDWRESERDIRLKADLRNPLRGLGLWIREYKIVSGAVLALAVLAVLVRDRKTAVLALLVGVFLTGLSLQQVQQMHYLAPGLGVLSTAIVFGIRALAALPVRGRRPGRLLPLLLVATAAVGLAKNTVLTLTEEGGHWGARREAILSSFDAEPGKHLVFVRYAASHDIGREWVYNGAELDAEKVLFVRDISPEANRRLLAFYQDRRAWLFLPDESDRLAPWPSDPAR